MYKMSMAGPETHGDERGGRTPVSMSCMPFREPFWMISSSLALASFATGSWDKSYVERMSGRFRNAQERVVNKTDAKGE